MVRHAIAEDDGTPNLALTASAGQEQGPSERSLRLLDERRDLQGRSEQLDRRLQFYDRDRPGSGMSTGPGQLGRAGESMAPRLDFERSQLRARERDLDRQIRQEQFRQETQGR